MLIPLKRNYLFTAIGVASFLILVQFIPDPLIESWINSAPRSCQGLFCSWAILVARNSFFLSHSQRRCAPNSKLSISLFKHFEPMPRIHGLERKSD